MNKTIFETRQRANELMAQAVDIWQQSPVNEKLEGLEKDPVMGLMMTALAYQSNVFEDDIARLKTDIIDEFASMMIPFESGHAIPATAVISTNLEKGIPDRWIDERTTFQLSGTDFGFIPLLRTHVYGVNIVKVVRLDGRRWKVSLEFDTPITHLSGMMFAFRNLNFRDLRITHKGKELPLYKPWYLSELPFSSCFSFDTMLYGRSQAYSPSQLCLDLFARQNVRLYGFQPHGQLFPIENDVTSVDLVFEFFDIRNDFSFDMDSLLLNAVILVNAKVQSASLTQNAPVVRVSGYAGTDNAEQGTMQFLHMMRPSDEQVFSNTVVEVRRMSADRFNPHELIRLLRSVVNKYQSDFYAFQQIAQEQDSQLYRQLLDLQARVLRSVNGNNADQGNALGTYLLLRNTDDDRPVSLNVNYLVTSGATVNSILRETSTFDLPTGFSTDKTRQIAVPVEGFNEINNQGLQAQIARYYMVTNNRIVTPADIKIFCLTELMTRFGLNSNMISSVTVLPRYNPSQLAGFEISVNITIADTPYVRRSMGERLPTVSVLLQKMMQVRSANLYPIIVDIDIK